jgi:hypothetical protein
MKRVLGTRVWPESFPQYPEVRPKRGCAEGRSPFAGSLRVSLKCNFFPFLARNRINGMVERDFGRTSSPRIPGALDGKW